MKNKFSRREFLKLSAAGSVILPSMGRSVSEKGKKPVKPNLLFIWTDEQRADTFAAYGNRMIHAPNLNKLAAESFIFEQPYVTQPVCTPNRASVMTGFWPHQTGCLKNNIPLRKETKCFPELLNDPAYKTAYMGKWHLGDEIFAQHGFGEWVSIEDGYWKYYQPGRDQTARSDYHHFLLKNGFHPDTKGRFSRSFAAHLPIEFSKPKFLGMKASEFLKNHRNDPFLLYVNFLEPHMPFWGPLNNEHNPAKIILPGNFSDPLDVNDPLRYRVKREALIEKYGKSEKEIRELIARYYGLVTEVDRSVGKILDTLNELGLAENTIVVYTSDHGDMMGAHHMVEKSVMFQEAVKVPWLLRVPWLANDRRTISGPVSQIDLVPTLLDVMNAEENSSLPGKSLLPLLTSKKDSDDDVFIQWNPNSGAIREKSGGTKLAPREELKRVENESSRAVITPDGWKLVLSDADKCQLYNLNTDPGETTNLFYSGKFKPLIQKLTGKITRWQQTVSDSLNLSKT